MKENNSDFFSYEICYDDKTFLYGINCLDADGKTIAAIENIGKKEVTERFCQMLNESKVFACHFFDVYEDYFG